MPLSSRFTTAPLGSYRSRCGGDLRREVTLDGDLRAFFPESDLAIASATASPATQGWLHPKMDPRWPRAGVDLLEFPSRSPRSGI
jgi:hypothetical protein